MASEQNRPTIIENPPKQGTPYYCVVCDTPLSPEITFGEIKSPMCWDCWSTLEWEDKKPISGVAKDNDGKYLGEFYTDEFGNTHVS